MLLEEDDASGDIFRCLVGNLPPGAEATIKFAYVIELQLSPEGAVTFVLPTQLNPRYNPSESGLCVYIVAHRHSTAMHSVTVCYQQLKWNCISVLNLQQVVMGPECF